MSESEPVTSYSDPQIYKTAPGLMRTVRAAEDGGFVLGVHQDIEPIVEQNKRIRELQQANGSRGEIFRKIASVPIHVYEQSIREQWDDNDWKRWLNASENKHFRVYEGSI